MGRPVEVRPEDGERVAEDVPGALLTAEHPLPGADRAGEGACKQHRLLFGVSAIAQVVDQRLLNVERKFAEAPLDFRLLRDEQRQRARVSARNVGEAQRRQGLHVGLNRRQST